MNCLKQSALVLVFLAGSLPAQDYGGPSVLSRGGAAPGTRGGQLINFTYYGGFVGTYYRSAIPLTDSGKLQSVDFNGGSAEVGLTGSHLWRRAAFGVDYRGSFRYDNNTYFTSGSEQGLSLFYSARLNNKTQIVLAETATTSSYSFGNYTAAAAATGNFIGVPLNDLFDSRVYSTQSTATVLRRLTRRVSFLGSADAFKIFRDNKSLVGVNGTRATGSAMYTLSRRANVSVTYGFMKFVFPRAFGDSYIHSISVGGTYRLTRGWALSYSGGIARSESLGVESVTLVPEIAELLGLTTGVRSVYNRATTNNLNFSLNYSRKRSNFNVSYNQGISPGNGIYLTSDVRTANIGYSYSGIRKTSLSVNAGYYRYSSVLLNFNDYGSYQAGLTVNYMAVAHMNLFGSFDMRSFQIVAGQRKVGAGATFGILFTPSRLPLPAW